MKKTVIIEGVLKMRFEDIYGRYKGQNLTMIEAAELLGISERTFRRKKDRYEEEGLEGVRDLRLGKRSGKRAEDKEVGSITKLYSERYRGFSVKHFHEFAQREHGLKYGYTWTKNALEKAGLVKRGKKGGDHRLRRERRPMEGMMIHQDGSTHEWVSGLGEKWDLVVTLDDATSTITSGFFVPEEGSESSFRGIRETIETYGIFCSFYTDRGSHYWYTPVAGGKVSKHELTQVGRALKQLGIRHIAAYSPEARGRSERLFGTLQGRLPKEMALQGIKTIDEANRYLKEVYIPRHNAQFSVKAKEEKSAYVKWAGGDQLKEILCVHEEREVQKDNTVRYKGMILQIPRNDMRHHYVQTKVEVRDYNEQGIGLFYGHMVIGRYTANGFLVGAEKQNKEPKDGDEKIRA